MAFSSPHIATSFDEHIGILFQRMKIPGVCLTFLVLCAYAYVYWHPVSRPSLNRVSFRLLVLALTANFAFGICYLAANTMSGPSAGCSFVAFMINFCLLFSACMSFCMGLNLELVLVHSFNGQLLEKYYVLLTLALCALCSIILYAAGKYGNSWNALCEMCWSVWILFMAPGEQLAFLLVAGYFISY
ncbi:hypothetical protein B0H17DRAFT_1200094 [Mycena rosella]|uniref:Uncharacterized protein n=1 Tax=Mycena rosella TaxID=1033263 RepID=A0AAD7C685_MYCRO|nr:hypothetical protein B0H17DRAFT_1216774 [Mycena rosella]KAJ7693028.1 hypothetical protein B0H17DRAFT_1200094 [Mycena rosella]